MASTATRRRRAGVRVGPPGRLPPVTFVAAWLRGWRLDSQLAAGVEPWRTPLHAARSLQITSPRARLALARSLDELLSHAQKPARRPAISAAIPPDRRAVLGARSRLAAIADRLRDEVPVRAAGVAALRGLLADGAGPLYNPLSGVGLGRVLASIQDALEVPE